MITGFFAFLGVVAFAIFWRKSGRRAERKALIAKGKAFEAELLREDQ